MKRNILLTLTVAALASAPLAFGADSTLGVTVAPEASFTTLSATTALNKGDTTFGAYTGTTNFTYKIRTTTVAGTGAITVLVTTFGAGGPAVADLTYTCTAPSPGTACAGSTPASTSVASSVVAFVADAHSSDSGDSGTTVWTLVDKPSSQTGAYSSTATYTISAT